MIPSSIPYECGRKGPRSASLKGHRVYGGESAKLREWPWAVRLIFAKDGKFFGELAMALVLLFVY